MMSAPVVLDLHGVRLRARFALQPDARAYAVNRNIGHWDSTYVPAVAGHTRAHLSLNVLIEGTVDYVGQLRATAPAIYVVPTYFVDGEGGTRPVTVRTTAGPYRSMEVCIRKERFVDPKAPRALALNASMLACAEQVLANTENGAVFEAQIRAFVDAAVDAEIVDANPFGPSRHDGFFRLFSGFDPKSNIITAISAKVLAATSGLSIRQLFREVSEIVNTLPIGLTSFGDTTRHYRMRLAIYLLSVESLSITEVAEGAGFGSAIAMAHAFKREGLKAPREIQRLLAESAIRMREELPLATPAAAAFGRHAFVEAKARAPYDSTTDR